jgi:amino acid transporter
MKTDSADSELLRTIGRGSLAALVLNNIIGSAIFILPGTIGKELGWMSLPGWVAGALITVVMMLCFAEVASRFSTAGGAYIFVGAAFGSFVGIQIGWLTYFARAVTAALQANLFATYLAELIPWAGTRVGGIAFNTAFIGFLTAVNLRSVKSGARVSDVMAVVKLTPLFLLGALGVGWVALGKGTMAASVHPTIEGWLASLLLLVFGYGGYESALIPLSEARNPRKDAPFALFFGLGLVLVLYLMVQVTVLGTVPDLGSTNRPLAAAARAMLGPAGAVTISIVALISVSGWLAANLLSAPRLSMAMAHQGDLPRFFGYVHPEHRTPWVSIVVFGALSWVMANLGGLLENLSLSAVSRLFIYGGVCAALPVLRRKEREGDPTMSPALFRSPSGPLLAVVAVVVSLVLATRMNLREASMMGASFVLATAYWMVAKRRSTRRST